MSAAAIGGIVALAAAVAGFAGGWQARDWKAGADDAARFRREEATRVAAAARIDAAAMRHETARATLRTRERIILQEVDRVVEKPVYRDRECFDADGMRQLARAVSGADPAEPPGAVRAPDDAAGRERRSGAALGGADGDGAP